MVDFIIGLLEGGALLHLERCAIGHELDAGFDAGEFSQGQQPGEEEADDFLSATGYWYQAELDNREDDLDCC